MQKTLTQPLTNLQLELLKIFNRQVDEKELLEIKDLLAQYYAKKTIELADAVWEKNNWDEVQENNFLNEHHRTPYKN